MATYVLVHGSYQGGWIWKDVASRLRAAGHEVYAPSLDGCAERKGAVRPGITTETQADEVAQLLFYEDLRDVVLVGTSSGGMVVCRVAEQVRERVKRLVFRRCAGADARREDPRHRHPLDLDPERRRADRRTVARGCGQPAVADLDPKLREWALERYTQHPIGIYNEPVQLNSFWQQQWPGTLVVWCRRAQNPGEAHQRRAAERLCAKWEELDTGHYPMLSVPEELTRLLLAD